MVKASLVGRCFVLGLMLTSSGVAHSQVAASSDIVGRWRSPNFIEQTIFGQRRDSKRMVTDTLAARTTILFNQDSTWLSYTTFRLRNDEQSHNSTLLNSGGTWRRSGDTLWLAVDDEWYEAAIEYTPDGEAVVRNAMKSRPQPVTTAWRPYRATMQNQRLSVGRFGATETTAASDPLVCGTAVIVAVVNYDRLVCPGVYDRRTASTP